MPKDTFYNLPEQKRERILNAAIEQFSKAHYKNVTIDNIVKDAGIPKGSFYQYFENKDDLYIYLFTEVAETKNNLFEQLKPQIGEITFKEYMMKYIGELKNMEASSPKLQKLKQEFLNECPQEINKQILANELPKSAKMFQAVIEGYIEKGEFKKDLKSKVAAYIALMSISNLQYYPFEKGEDVLTVLSNITNFLVSGMEQE